MLGGSKAIGQTKRDTLVLQVGGWGMRMTASLEGCYQGGQGSQRAVVPDKKKKISLENY
jgi:hypothetical protein